MDFRDNRQRKSPLLQRTLVCSKFDRSIQFSPGVGSQMISFLVHSRFLLHTVGSVSVHSACHDTWFLHANVLRSTRVGFSKEHLSFSSENWYNCHNEPDWGFSGQSRRIQLLFSSQSRRLKFNVEMLANPPYKPHLSPHWAFTLSMTMIIGAMIAKGTAGKEKQVFHCDDDVMIVFWCREFEFTQSDSFFKPVNDLYLPFCCRSLLVMRIINIVVTIMTIMVDASFCFCFVCFCGFAWVSHASHVTRFPSPRKIC